MPNRKEQVGFSGSVSPDDCVETRLERKGNFTKVSEILNGYVAQVHGCYFDLFLRVTAGVGLNIVVATVLRTLPVTIVPYSKSAPDRREFRVYCASHERCSCMRLNRS